MVGRHHRGRHGPRHRGRHGRRHHGRHGPRHHGRHGPRHHDRHGHAHRGLYLQVGKLASVPLFLDGFLTDRLGPRS